MVKVNSSERLRYKLMDESDADLLFELDQDPAVMKYLTQGKPSSRTHINNVLLPRMQQYRNPNKGWGLWQVSHVESESFIGWILARPMNFFSDNRNEADIELGWRFMQRSWGQGYATEAAKAVMMALHRQVGYHKFTALAVPANKGSIRIMEKIGMSYQKTAVHKDPLGDIEAVYYSVALPKI
ncbi:MAG: GNAT family N-acetyltransferase [Proteobacteria bacterium]|nr:GNAT family N-acetyltransferase [Pseudomonadota bacterium]